MAEQTTLGRRDLPSLYRAASDASAIGQRRFQRTNFWGLVALIVAAVAGLGVVKVGVYDAAGVVAALAFFIALLLRTFRLITHPDQIWYEGRAIAESAKTVAWRYAVGGSPFGLREVTERQAEDSLVRRLQGILKAVKRVALTPSNDADEITPAMRAMRASSLDQRKRAYESGRIENQRVWYADKARWNKRRAEWWNGVLLVIEIAGVAAAVAKILGLLPLDLLGVAGTLIAAGTSWLQAKQYHALAKAYAVAAFELGTIKASIAAQSTEEEWARFVNQAEEAISREHTLWLASRSEPPLPAATI